MARNLPWFDDLAGSLGKYPWWAHAAAALWLWVAVAGVLKWVGLISLLLTAALSVWSRNRGIALHHATAQDGGLAALRAMPGPAGAAGGLICLELPPRASCFVRCVSSMLLSCTISAITRAPHRRSRPSPTEGDSHAVPR